jgi:para-aminobenzoate synthetase component I
MRVVPLALRRDPLDVLASIATEPGAFLLEVPDPRHPATLLGCAPRVILGVGADGASERSDGLPTPADPLAAIEHFVRETPALDLPFPLGGGAVGYLAYELGQYTAWPAHRRSSQAARDVPLAVLARYDPLLVYERSRGQYLLLCDHPESASVAWLGRLTTSASHPEGPLATSALAAPWSVDGYDAAAWRILAYLAAGDAYQVNLTQPFTTALAAPAWALYTRLATRHPVPYGAYLDLGGSQLVMNSPELFLRRRGARVETRPIKGTRPRGASVAEDTALAAELLADPKERAEHVMIVDLERNDLGRVAATGSVTVEAHARLESHPTVHHLVSRIVARLRDGIGLTELLRATFPGGSITGAPKLRAMEIIAELEPWARGAYTGAIGLFHPGGDLELGLAIRTATVAGGLLRYPAGGGIVIDSRPERELAEAWLKTAALRLALGEETEPELQRCSSG